MKDQRSPTGQHRKRDLRRPLAFRWRIAALIAAVTQLLVATPVPLSAAINSAADGASKDSGTQPPAPSGQTPRVTGKKVAPPPNVVPAPASFKFPVTDDELRSCRELPEILVPIGGKTTTTEKNTLAEAILLYVRSSHDISGLENFVGAHPKSPWLAAVLTNLGIVYRKTGYYTKALEAWKKAWALSKNETQYPQTVVADRAVGDLSRLLSSVGRTEELKPLLDSIQDRKMYGAAATNIMHARTALAVMQKKPGRSFKCGPFALGRIQHFLHPDQAISPVVLKAKSSTKGFSLSQVADLSKQMNLNFRVAKRSAGVPLVLPAVVHWKAGHYAAILKKVNDRYLVQDPTFGRESLLSKDAIDAESSGYYLIAQGNLPAGWTSVATEESDTVWGRGFPQGRDDQTHDCDNSTDCGGGGCFSDLDVFMPPGMARYDILLLLACLRIRDTPVYYQPAVGPSLGFTVTYNQYEMSQIEGIPTSNLGNNWINPWQSYVISDGVAGDGVTVVVRGGGVERYDNTSYNAATGFYGTQVQLQTKLSVVTNPDHSLTFTRWFSDGSREVFNAPDGRGNIFLSQYYDPQNNAISFNYSPAYLNNQYQGYQLTTVTDTMGLHTTLSYGLAADPLKITAITEHYGRTAKFGYTLTNGKYQLTSITDVVGIESQFAYAPGTDAITSLTTPYGTTTFEAKQDLAFGDTELIVTDPNGGKERALARYADYIDTPQEPLPQVDFAYSGGVLGDGDNSLEELNTYYWDKKAMMDAPGDLTKSHVYHWLFDGETGAASGVLYCEKRALESRVWYNYQRDPAFPNPYQLGTSDRPTGVARLLDDGTTQYYQYQYNANGMMTASIAPLPNNRQFAYTYDATNNIDLTEVSSHSGAVLKQIQYDNIDNPPHLPATIIDASGQQTSFSYNSYGQRLSETNALGETTSYTYDGNQHLTTVTDPSGASSTLTYDDYGRIQTHTTTDGYTITCSYDALNRLTTVTYPDGTYEQMVYNIMDVGWRRDRLGRWTTFYYDAVRNLVAVEDPLGRLTRYGYCNCGALISLTDPAGHFTGWVLDIQKRPIATTYADGTQILYSYDLAGRLTSVTDPKGQVKKYTYLADSTRSKIDYLNTLVPMHSVSYNYDPFYRRVSSRDDGTGTTAYAYNPYSNTPLAAVTTGAGRVVSETGPLATITYGYDELGRTVSRSVTDSQPQAVSDINSETTTFDNLGRVRSDGINANSASPYGTFYYDYDRATDRLLHVHLNDPTSPTSIITNYTFYGNANTPGGVNSDRRLLEIQNLVPTSPSAGGNISQFDYAYDVVGKIATWKRQMDGDPTSATIYTFEYDSANQLTGAVLQNSSTQAIVHSHYYGYDAGSNRTSVQWDNHVVRETPNTLNQLVTRQGGGVMRFSGTLNEPAAVTVGGNPATVNTTAAGTTFFGYANVTAGTNNVVVSATDSSGQNQTKTYQVAVDASAPTQNLVYDVNGNLTSDGTRTFGWDAENRLVSITSDGIVEQFIYNGIGQRVGQTLKGILTRQWVWDGRTLREERDGAGNVTKRYYGQGMQQASANGQVSVANYFYTRDRLGSIREMVDSAGSTRARYDYDVWGRQTEVSGDLQSDFGYTGDYWDNIALLNLTFYRAYQPDLGRWLSRDPIAEAGGINLYDYVHNDPVDQTDPLGLFGFPGGHPEPDAPPQPPVPGMGGRYESVVQSFYKSKCECEKRGGRWGQVYEIDYGGNFTKCVADKTLLPFPISGPLAFASYFKAGAGIPGLADITQAFGRCSEWKCSK